MNAPHINPARRSFSASRAVEVAGQVLSEIKDEDGLTFRDLGRVLGKGVDQAERIAKGHSVMDMPTFLAACDYWGERFADRIMTLAHLRTAPCGAKCSTGERGSKLMARLLHPIMEAEEDGIETADELRPHEAAIRAVHERTAAWLETIAAAPKLRQVGEGR
jgi:hypothetical protein